MQDLDMQYNLVYAEESKTPTSTTWTLRQIGVFCRYVPNSDGNIWIFLHGKEDSKVQSRISAAMEKWEVSGTRRQSWYSLHLVVLSSYFNNWRFYLASLNQELERIADIALTLEFSKSSHYTDGYTLLRKLKHLEDKVLPLAARFRTTLATVLELNDTNKLFHAAGHCERQEYLDMCNDLKSYETHLNGHLVNVNLLEKRVREILSLVRSLINI